MEYHGKNYWMDVCRLVPPIGMITGWLEAGK